MTHSIRISVLAAAVAAGWALPAQAQDANGAAVARELAAMRAQMTQMASRIDTLEAQLTAANAKADAATTAANAAASATAAFPAQIAAVHTATAKPATQITWDGAPKLATSDGWSFKPRGRLQVDAGSVSAPGLPTVA
ncbi:MAG: porin, partial [Novosphingobium sp.]